MMEVIAQKITSLQRSVARAREALTSAGTEFRTNYNLQDAAILNVKWTRPGALMSCENKPNVA